LDYNSHAKCNILETKNDYCILCFASLDSSSTKIILFGEILYLRMRSVSSVYISSVDRSSSIRNTYHDSSTCVSWFFLSSSVLVDAMRSAEQTSVVGKGCRIFYIFPFLSFYYVKLIGLRFSD
jgi:hypothetical protein